MVAAAYRHPTDTDSVWQVDEITLLQAGLLQNIPQKGYALKKENTRSHLIFEVAYNDAVIDPILK